MSPRAFLLRGLGAVVAYDAAASAASLIFRFPYIYATVGSVLIYAIGGFLLARVRGFMSSALAGAFLGSVDATLGWAISWLLGPGRPSAGALSVNQWLLAAVSVVLLAVVCSCVGGTIAALSRPRSNRVA